MIYKYNSLTMSVEYKNIQINGERVVFVRDLRLNPNPEKFTKDDALNLATCPNLLKAAERAYADSYEDKFCERCGKVSVEYMPLIKTYRVSGKCPQK